MEGDESSNDAPRVTHAGGTPSTSSYGQVNMLAFTPVPPNPEVDGHYTQTPPPITDSIEAVLSPPPQPVIQVPPPLHLQQKKVPNSAPRKRRSGGESAAQIKENHLKEYVRRLLDQQQESFADAEFAEKALLNLARKVAATGGQEVLKTWEDAVVLRDPNLGCVTVTRPKDGRLTVPKPGSGTKKVFPQIIVCQAFRWPQIVFHNDIRSLGAHCENPGLVKAPEGETATELICVNPYHYELTLEAINRFNKASRKSGDGQKLPLGTAPVMPKTPKNKRNPVKKTAKPQVKTKPDDERLDFDAKGVDFISHWQEQAVKPKTSGIQKFNADELLAEIEFLALSKETGKVEKADKDFIDALKILDELDPILQGDYLEEIDFEEDVEKIVEEEPDPAPTPFKTSVPTPDDSSNDVELIEERKKSYESKKPVGEIVITPVTSGSLAAKTPRDTDDEVSIASPSPAPPSVGRTAA